MMSMPRPPPLSTSRKRTYSKMSVAMWPVEGTLAGSTALPIRAVIASSSRPPLSSTPVAE